MSRTRISEPFNSSNTKTNISDYSGFNSDPSEDSVSDNEEGNDEENDDMGAMFSDDGDAGYYMV
ncbi:7442_t:CDS:2 [Paraglomus brasilianum]|uniref:7442_t:CDS:1 n=1 Tax=Paraglomus brasilianum TaxID=144538 RepID=A0A9N9GFQ9_9GLOM|nr:7442_t:CDS:2 [Paraglomus brasilianum]